MLIRSALVAVAWSLMPAMTAHALTVSLELYVDFNELVDSGNTALADGSIIQIIGSSDGTAGFFQPYGDAYLADTTTGNDVILATTYVGAGGYAEAEIPGRFGFVFDGDYDITAFPYVYIRFFNTDNFSSLAGNPTALAWGTSDVFRVDLYPIVEDEIYFIDFSEGGNLVANQTNTFTVIPEPSSISFFALVGGMAIAMRSQLIRRKRRQRSAVTQDDLSTA